MRKKKTKKEQPSNSKNFNKPLLSVIIPLSSKEEPLNEKLLNSVFSLSCPKELITAAARKPSKSEEKFLEKVKWFYLEKESRGYQLNFGAKASRGTWLWFLHADTLISNKALKEIEKIVKKKEDVLYFFRLGFFNSPTPLIYLNYLGCIIRSELFKIPFGDQGFLIKKNLFFKLNGFKNNLSRGEDHHFVWKLRKNKILLKPLKAKIYTSARKYKENGWLKQTALNLYLTLKQIVYFTKNLKKEVGK